MCTPCEPTCTQALYIQTIEMGIYKAIIISAVIVNPLTASQSMQEQLKQCAQTSYQTRQGSRGQVTLDYTQS